MDLRGAVAKAASLTGQDKSLAENPSSLNFTPEAEIIIISLARRVEELELEWS
jgi:hypothetical protein